MARPEKVQAVTDIKERITGASAVFLAEYAGLSVKAQQNLRRSLKANEAEFKVVKMTLARRAVAELDIEEFDELLLGPTGIAFAAGDPAIAAKMLRDFAKDHETFIVKGGLLDGDFLTPERIAALASLDSREVLLAKVAGVFKAPMAQLAGLLAAMPRNAAGLFKALLDKRSEEEGVALADAGVPVADTEPDAAPEADAEADETAPEADVEAEAAAEAAPEDSPADEAPEPAAEPAAEGNAEPEADEVAPQAEVEPEAVEEAASEDSSAEEPAAEADVELEAAPEAEADAAPTDEAASTEDAEITDEASAKDPADAAEEE